MRKILGTLVATAGLGLGTLTAPPAGALPDVTDLARLQAVGSDSFYTYHTYGAGGWQLATPDGVHCRIMMITRWQSPPTAFCWGVLPGVTGTTNYVFAKGPWFDDSPRSGFDTMDLDTLESYRSYEHRSGPEIDPVDPDSYHLLAARTKLVVTAGSSTVTCGVPDESTVVCAVQGSGPDGPTQDGFVLSPRGSRLL